MRGFKRNLGQSYCVKMRCREVFFISQALYLSVDNTKSCLTSIFSFLVFKNLYDLDLEVRQIIIENCSTHINSIKAFGIYIFNTMRELFLLNIKWCTNLLSTFFI